MKRLFLTLFFSFLAVNLFAREYTNNIRSDSDRTKSVFRIKRTDGAVQHLSGFQIPILSGYVASTTTASVLSFSATADPNLSAVQASGSIALRFLDAEVAPVAYSFRLPDNYISGGNIRLIASAASGVSSQTYVKAQVIVNQGVLTALTAVAVAGDAYAAYNIDYSTISLSAGDRISLLITRDENGTTAATAPLEIKDIYFRYNESIDWVW